MDTTRATLHYFWRHAWTYKRLVLGVSASVPLAVLGTQFLPQLVVSNILDRLSKGQFTHGDAWGSFGGDMLLFAFALLIGGVVMWRVADILIWKLEIKVLGDIYREEFAHLIALDAKFHANNFGGSLVSRANKLAGAYIRVADTTTFGLASLLLSFLFAAIILFPRVPLVAVIILLFSAIFMVSAILLTKPVRRVNSIEAQAENHQTGFLADAVTNVLAIKSFASGRHERTRYGQAVGVTTRAMRDTMTNTIRVSTVFSITTNSLSVIALGIAIAGTVVLKADVANTFLVVSYTSVIVRGLWDFSQNMLRSYNRAFGDSRDMIQTFAIEPEVKDPARPEKVRITKGEIVCDNVVFAHDGSEALFGNLNLHIRPGEKIGLVGHSGSGKTTLTKLLLRFSDIDAGEIRIDGQNIAKITQDDLRTHIAYVPQEPLLFHRSIRENIAYGKPDATDAEVHEAARKANAAEFIETLPKGYETLVGERGVKLSGGQRQRIAIARAILKDAPILVLDEATSALDSESELLIQAALRELMKKRTAIVIAHRLSTIQKMDRIIVLEDGNIVEEGSHAELIKHKGTYAQLWAHQSGGFIEE